MENEYTVQDMISLSYEQKPLDFQQAFDQIMANKITAAIDAKKIEVAASLYDSSEGHDGEEEIVDDAETLDQEDNTDGDVS